MRLSCAVTRIGTSSSSASDAVELRGDEDRHLELEREVLEAADHAGELLVARAGAGDEVFQRVDDREPQVERAAQRVGEPGDAAARQRLDAERRVADAHRRGADARAGAVVHHAAAQVVDARAALDGEQALRHALRRHLAGEERDRPGPGDRRQVVRAARRPLAGTVGHGERQRRLPARDVAAEDDEVALAQPAAEQLVDAREPGRDGIRGRDAVGDRVDAAHDVGEGRMVDRRHEDEGEGEG
jgi:hypothetical protein